MALTISGGKCPKCDELASELDIVSYSYYVAGEHLHEPESGELPIFFVSFEFEQSRRDLFIEMGVDRVPAIGVSTPKMASGSRSFGEKVWLISNDDNVEAQKALENINNLFKKDVQLSYTIKRILMGNVLIIGIVALAFIGRNFLRQMLMMKPVWFILSGVIFVACVGGTAYNMIHGVPTFRQAQDPNTGEIYVDEYF